MITVQPWSVHHYARAPKSKVQAPGAERDRGAGRCTYVSHRGKGGRVGVGIFSRALEYVPGKGPELGRKCRREVSKSTCYFQCSPFSLSHSPHWPLRWFLPISTPVLVHIMSPMPVSAPSACKSRLRHPAPPRPPPAPSPHSPPRCVTCVPKWRRMSRQLLSCRRCGAPTSTTTTSPRAAAP